MSERKLRWGIIGCAGIAMRSVIPGIQASETGTVVAVASRDQERASRFASQLGIPKAYGSYETLLMDDEIDAVYIPLPNHEHKPWTIRAAQAGKHVLCEKPAALTAEEAAEMVEVCAKNGVQFAEAFMYRHHPRYERVMDFVRAGDIGEIRGMHGTFTFNNAAATENIRFHTDMGGGGLYDVGCYPISAARMILQKEPEAVTVRAYFSPLHGNVDMMAAGLIEFPGDVALTFDCGMWAHGRNTLEILGTEGRIEIPSAFVAPMNEESNFRLIRGNDVEVISVPPVNHFALEADDLGYSILEGRQRKFPAMDAVLNMRVLEACLSSATLRERIVL